MHKTAPRFLRARRRDMETTGTNRDIAFVLTYIIGRFSDPARICCFTSTLHFL
jgi:hypothetical protein